ncbi:tail fiber domain-containing protein [Citrobacter portucalensis]|uniref:tail fiber domain-containing protein n=1 Tax=Citrobacter portucalensis TaxID=1639133 RepID=UPI003B24CD10
MANNKVKHYRTDVAGRKPEAKNMLDGEIAINLADRKIFTKLGDSVINIGNGADAVVEGGQTFTGKIKASYIESDSNLTLKNLDKSDIVFADEHGKAKARISSPAQTDAKGELRITVEKGKATGERSDFVLNGNGQFSLPSAPAAPESATRKDYVDSEISKVQTGSSADLTKLEQKVDANDAAINTRVDNLNSKVDQNDTAINTKVDANKADADEKIKAVNDRLTVDNQTLTNMINEKVSKSGDTMTGDLTVPKLNADGIKTNYINLGSNPNALGSNSIMTGDSDTGFKWREDGWLNFYSNNVVTASIAGSENFFNRKTHFRFRSDADGNVNEIAPEGNALIQIDTTTDGNNVGDATSYFGLVNSGKYYHYLRGSGRTFIDTKEGLGVSGPASFYQTIYNYKSYGSYDSESLPVWNAQEQQSNHLRKLRARNDLTIFHEAVVGQSDDPRATNSISWFHGVGPDNFIASMQGDGTINATRFNTSAEYEAINLKTKNREAAYIRGTDGDKTSWLFGRLSPGENRLIARSTINQDESSTVDLELDSGNKYFGVNVGGNRIARFHEKNIIIDGRKWAADNSHAWADQWNQLPPVTIEFGDQAGTSDYYPGYGLQSVSLGKGWPTRVELGMIRDNAIDNGKGVLRVASINEEGRKDIAANYIFDAYGGFFTNKVNAQQVETNRITSFGVNTHNSIGGNSITFGDNDTGIRQRTDGHLEIISDSIHLATFNPSGLNTVRQIAVNSPNESRGIYVGNTRTGEGNAMIQGQVEGWADWGAWRIRPAGMIVEAPARNKCINIWKHVHWGSEYGAAMDVYNPEGAAPAAQLHVGGANYHFDGNGTASAPQWVSTSDKRLKSNFEEIENAVDKVEKLTGYVYDKKSDLVETEYSFEVREAGIIAQDLKEVLPEAVSSFGEDEILGVNPAAVNALLVNAIKELSARVKELEAK